MGGLLYTSCFRFGAALGLSSAGAVLTAATDGAGPQAVLDGYRAALVVPLVAASIAALVAALGLHGRAGDRAGGPASASGPLPEPAGAAGSARTADVPR
ncbi:hypothetical protein [Streptomyces sennicomposti]